MNTIDLTTVPSTRALERAGWTAILACGAALPAQRFQYDYGAGKTDEIGTALVRVDAGYAIAGWHAGREMFGLGLNLTGLEQADGSYAALQPTIDFTPHCARATAAGGFIVSGEVVSMPNSDLEVLLAKFDQFGNNTWNGRFPTYRGHATGLRQGTRVIETTGGFVALSNLTRHTQPRGVLFGTDTNLLLTWWKSYTYNNLPVVFHDLCQEPDGNLCVVGTLDESGPPATLIMKTDPTGVPLVAWIYRDLGDVDQQSVLPTSDGRVAVWGHFRPNSSAAGSFFLEITALGGIVCLKRFATVLGSRPMIARTADGDLLCNGRVGNDALILRLAADCTLRSATRYGTPDSVDELFQVVTTPDGGFAAVGASQIVDTTTRNVYVVKADASGDSSCYWVRWPLTPTNSFSRFEVKRLQWESDRAQSQVYHRPPVPRLTPRELCFEPGCVKAPRDVNVWLPFDEAVGPSAFNVLSLLGTPNGTHGGNPTPVAGQVAGALSFDGVDDNVVVPHHAAADIGVSDFTLDAWIRVPAGLTGVKAIVDKRTGPTASARGYSFFLYGTQSGYQLGVQLADGTYDNYLSPVLPVVANQWHFVAVRVDRDGTSQFVLDGNFYGFVTAHPLSLANSAPFTVGQNSPGLGGARFRGDIDEVELFRRALTPNELFELWRAGRAGKCKEDCFLPGEIGLCLNQNTTTINYWICNATTQAHTYTCWFAGLPSGGGCAIHGPTQFTPASPITHTVAAGTCQMFSVTVQRPVAMTAANQAGCYELMVQSDSGETMTCKGKLRDRSDVCTTGGGWDHTVAKVRPQVTTPLGPVRLTNTTSAPLQLNYQFAAIDETGAPEASVLSIDGRAPGIPSLGSALLQPGGFVDLQVRVEFLAPTGLSTYTVRLEADLDGDSVPDYLGGRALRCDLAEGSPPVYSGIGAPTTAGVPLIDVNRNPRIGDSGFEIRTTVLAPNAPALFAVAGVLASSPFPLLLIGGQPNSFVYPDLATGVTIPSAANAAGRCDVPLPIPADGSLVGVTLHWQVFSVDAQLPFAFPVGNSNAMTITIR